MVDYLSEKFNDQDDITTVCIYCNYNEHEVQTPINLIASLWRQLVQRRASLSGEVNELYKSHIARSTRPTLNEVSKVLQSEVKNFSRIFIIVDALDECPKEKRSRAILISELRELQPRVNLMVTSRFLDTIACAFAGVRKIEINASIEDLQKYTEGRIFGEDQLLENVEKDPALGEEIIRTVAENAQQMFVKFLDLPVSIPTLWGVDSDRAYQVSIGPASYGFHSIQGNSQICSRSFGNSTEGIGRYLR